MTSIERLQISGIRSFNPDPSHAQTVHFQKPLTVILGKNGAGKTTVIEALLNACTGAMPPGSGGAEKSSFVYDPKVIGESEVKAQIRLIFTGKDGRNIQVIRSVQVTRTRNKTELKTLDNTVAYQDPTTGKVVSSTYRASDVDRVVPELLGVSPSVLKYVVFCHQEESNWPLSPPKDVKEIFDDLFAATRYVATLEKLRKVSQEKKKKLKDYETSLVALREHRRQAKELEENIAKKEEHIKAMESRTTSLEPDLRELRKAAASLDAVEQQADALAKEAAQIAGRMDQKRETIKRANLPPTKHTLEQVQELRSGLVTDAAKAEATVTSKTKLADAARDTVRQREQELFSLKAQIEGFEREELQHRRNVAELRELLRAMPELRNISDEEEGGTFVMSEGSVDARSLSRLMDTARLAVRRLRQQASESAQDSAERVAKEEGKRQQILRAMDADKKEREMTESILATLTQQMKEARATVQTLGGDACHEHLTHARREVETLQRRVEAADEVRSKGERSQRRQQIGKEFDEQNVVVARLRQAMARAKQRAGQEGEVDRLRERITERTTELNERLREDIVPKLLSLGIKADAGSTDFGAVAGRTEEARRRREDELHEARAANATLDRKVAALEQKRANAAEQLSQYQAEEQEKSAACAIGLRTLAPQPNGADEEDAGAAAPTLDHYEEYLSQARAASERAVQKRHAMEAMAAFYSGFAEAARTSNTCAVCERPFSDHDELHQFILKTEEKRRDSPKAIEAASLEAAQSHGSVQKLEAMQKHVHDVRRLRAAIPILEKELSQIEEDLERALAEQKEIVARVDRVDEVLARITAVAYQLQSLKGIDAEVAGLRSQLAVRERQLAEERARVERSGLAGTPPPEEHAGKTYEEQMEEYEAATEYLHRLNEQLAELQRMEEGSGATTVEKELLEKQRAMYQLELTATKVSDLQSTLSRLNEEHQSRCTVLRSLQARRTEQSRELEEATKALHQLTEEQKGADEAHSKAVNAAETRLRKLEGAAPSVLSYIKENKSTLLQAARDRLRSVEAAVQQAHQGAEALAADIQAARLVVSEHQARMAEVDRTIAVLELVKSLEADEARLRDVAASSRELKGTRLSNVEQLLGEAAKSESLPRLRELIRSKTSELERLQAQQQGSVEAMSVDVGALKQQLSLERYTNIEKRLRSTFLKWQSEVLFLKDADNYYAALEVGVQAYHKEKIVQINQIISELWRQTYRGSDIDTIEIRSETEATLSTASKRSYTYRVVIKRGDSELDMRGRCSAGQKVLASIIIRLALSETFCYDCGILALDEPTTNLDEDNARSLAESLRSLIELKRNVKNFQLIVITHDEQFVRALGGHHMDHFHYVHKDREGAFSVIEKRTFTQLFS